MKTIVAPTMLSLIGASSGCFDEAQLGLNTYRENTETSGNLHLEFVLLHESEPSTTSGSIDLPLQSDWGWSVGFHVLDENPEEGCFGCFGSKEFALDPELGFDPSMKLFVVWGGNSISNPVLY